MSEPPAGPPPPPYGAPPPPPRPSGLSNTARFWIGVLLALPALFVVGLVNGAAGALGSSIDPNGAVTSVLLGLANLLLLAGVVVAIVARPTRFFALGALAGAAVLAVVAAGICVALLSSLN